MSFRIETIDGVSFLLGATADPDAQGAGVETALDLGVARLKSLSEDAMSDLHLVSGGSLDVLPRSEAARVALEAARTAAHAGHAEHSAMAARYALTGALADQALSAMRSSDTPLMAAYVASGECCAFAIEEGTALDVPAASRGALWLEVVRALQPGNARGGIAVAGSRVPESADGDADAVAVYAGSTAEAALSAVLVADAVELSVMASRPSIPSPEDIGEALSKGIRALSPLKQANIVRGGILAFRGRGRLVGPISGDGLLRFGVSDWR